MRVRVFGWLSGSRLTHLGDERFDHRFEPLPLSGFHRVRAMEGLKEPTGVVRPPLLLEGRDHGDKGAQGLLARGDERVVEVDEPPCLPELVAQPVESRSPTDLNLRTRGMCRVRPEDEWTSERGGGRASMEGCLCEHPESAGVLVDCHCSWDVVCLMIEAEVARHRRRGLCGVMSLSDHPA